MSKEKSKKLFLAVTADEFELPIYVCDSGKELADKLGIAQGTIYSTIAHERNGQVTGRRIVKIEV